MSTCESNSTQQVAANLSDALELKEFRRACAALTPKQQALLADTRGLLDGIAIGRVATGNRRIFENLIEIIEFWPTTEVIPADTGFGSPLSSLLSTIRTAAAHGLSDQQMDLLKRRRASSEVIP